jgi:DNA alkylation repair enzyme
VIDELVYNLLAKTSLAAELCARWMRSPDELVGRAGWNLLIARILRRDTAGLDFDAILKEIEAEILSAPKRKQEAINRCLVEIGCHIPEFMQKCLDLGERLGFDKRPVPKGCTSTYAPEWIAAVLKRRKN